MWLPILVDTTVSVIRRQVIGQHNAQKLQSNRVVLAVGVCSSEAGVYQTKGYRESQDMEGGVKKTHNFQSSFSSLQLTVLGNLYNLQSLFQ